MTVTVRDVAASAQVSVATVSRVLSRSRRVGDANAKAVMDAADRLGYRPNRLARSLRRQVTDTIGLVVPQISNPFFPALVEHVDWQLQSGTRQLLLCDSHNDADIEARRLEALLDRQIDGILIIPCDVRASADAVRAAALRVPVVQVDQRVSAEVTDWVGVDDAVGMELVVSHLAAAGASAVAFVSCALTNSSARLRLDAFLSAVETRRLERGELLLGEFTVEWGLAAGRSLLDGDRLPDGIVCGNDLIAAGVLRQLTLAGVRVPDDVLVTGFDDVPAAALVTPSLTTVRQPLEAIVREALRLLSEGLERSRRPFQRVAISPELVVRASTSCNEAPNGERG
jgi:LacI family transcriptional regulator